ncbi:phospholipase D family protein [Vibrio sp. ZSDE26]|uniref:Phospholipase D family protein n=1 Tax=Vibrio amylolyticus TaxID=2847292 RepID=A0A9X1XL06_9VIBR|nr:phospholipase D family protein [Vibrio amylolyticus]MCK6263668.1 phospholipase D family protein [Vibrio amylolyticus]
MLIAFLYGCSSTGSIEPRAPKSVSHHYGYQEGSRLDALFHQSDYDTDTHTGFVPLIQGHDALLARLSLIETAETSIDLQYYIYRDDETSQLLTWRLYEAAKRGVRVRLLLDDMQKRSDRGMATLDAHPNIQVRLFNPHQYRTARGVAFLSDFERLNRRMHNKSITADSVVSIVGGRNIGNEYFSFESNVEFGDFDLLLYGNTVEQTADQFDIYWNSEYAEPIKWIYPNSRVLSKEAIKTLLEDTDLEKKFSTGEYNFTKLPFYQKLTEHDFTLYWGPAKLWYDMPDKVSGESSQLVDNLIGLLSSVEESLVLVTPYFVPTQSGTEALVDAVQSGKSITVITNTLASNDVFAVHGWYAKYRQDLVEGGVDLWEIKASANIDSKWSFTGSSRSSLHAKAMLLDDNKIFVGSMNWDPRSAFLNTEMAVVIEQPEYVQHSLSRMKQQLSANAYKVVVQDGKVVWYDPATGEILTSEPEASVWRRMGAWVSGLLPIEAQL